jgi:dTDP-4-dehydrorhamnose 3,5-epimerase
MKITKTPRLGLSIIHPEAEPDRRGYFMETYHQDAWKEAGLDYHFIQDNQSCSLRGTIRGLHYQSGPHAQAKLVRVVIGHIWDVALDIRPGSPTFGKWEGVGLSAANRKQLLIPTGYAHGFSVISPEAVVIYKCDQFYQPTAERGVNPLDRLLAIDWFLSCPPLLSDKDRQLPTWKNVRNNLNIIEYRR